MISWMIYATAVSLLVTGAARAGAALCTLYRVPARWCWAAALLCSISVPLIAHTVPTRVQANALNISATSYRIIEGAVGDGASVQRATPVPNIIAPMLPNVSTTVAVIWGMFSAALLSGLFLASARLSRARRSWRPQTVCGEPVLVSSDTGPAVVGLRRHKIVLPAWALELEDSELALAVTHEREHVDAHDPWLLAAAIITVALAPWNVALWLQLRELRRAVEGDCDARVLARVIPRCVTRLPPHATVWRDYASYSLRRSMAELLRHRTSPSLRCKLLSLSISLMPQRRPRQEYRAFSLSL